VGAGVAAGVQADSTMLISTSIDKTVYNTLRFTFSPPLEKINRRSAA
jgi:hypothetical protein